ncbi:MAG: hypothetical protein C0172_02525, partial [Caldisphaera sp.]
AYSKLLSGLKDKYQLVIASKVDDYNKAILEKLIRDLGLKSNIILTGYVSDEDLIKLYNLCDLFVFPSIHEGFGLPIVEAMACGAPVIASNTTSIPEVLGREDALFDPYDIDSIAFKMEEVITNEQLRNDLREYALERIKNFSWDNSAKKAIEAFEYIYNKSQKKTINILNDKKPKLAYISPLPPEKSGISSYSREFLPYLSKYYDIEAIVDQDKVNDSWILQNISIRNIDYFKKNYKHYDRVLYDITSIIDTYLHNRVLEFIKYFPGLLVCNERFIESLKNLSFDLSILQETIAVIYNPNQKHIFNEIDILISPKKFFVINKENKEEIAEEYKNAIELAYSYFNYNHFIDELFYITRDRNEHELIYISDTVAKNISPIPRLRQLLVDISYLAKADFKTGIQRVVKAQLKYLFRKPPMGYKLEPIYLENVNGKWIYKYARKFTKSFLNIDIPFEDEPIDIFDGDLFYVPDLHPTVYDAGNQGIYKYIRAKNAKIIFLVYDILPILRPDCFPEGAYESHSNWVKAIASYADKLICISQSLEYELKEYLEKNSLIREDLEITYLHLGSDISSAKHS